MAPSNYCILNENTFDIPHISVRLYAWIYNLCGCIRCLELEVRRCTVGADCIETEMHALLECPLSGLHSTMKLDNILLLVNYEGYRDGGPVFSFKKVRINKCDVF